MILNKIKKIPRYYWGYKFNIIKPQHLLFNITGKCNAKCKYCEIHNTDKNKQLSHNRLLEIFDEARALGIKEVTLSGGEPFFYDKIWELIDYILNLNLKLNIITNGLLINGFSQENINTLKKTNQVIVSLDSHESQINDALRGGPGFFNKTVSGIKILKENGIFCCIGTVLNVYNIETLNNFISFCKSLNVDYISFQPLHVYSNFCNTDAIESKSNLSLDTLNHETVVKRIRESLIYSKSINQKTNLVFIIQWIDSYLKYHKHLDKTVWMTGTLKKFRCIEVFDRLMINFDGSVLPCTMLDANSNLNDISLKQAIENLDEIKKHLRKGDFSVDCNKCSCQVSSNYNFSLMAFPLLNSAGIVKLLRDYL
jgi:AdoMet-dependent heme synthase